MPTNTPQQKAEEGEEATEEEVPEAAKALKGEERLND